MELVSSASIREINRLEARYLTPYGEAERDHASQVYIRYRKHLQAMAEMLELGVGIPSRLFVPYLHFFACTARVLDHNALDIRYRVPYGDGSREQCSSGIIPARNELASSAWVEPVHNDFIAGAYNPHLAYFNGLGRIAENLEMDIRYKLIQPPVLGLSTEAVHDTYVRQSKPTINYGASQSLVAGTAADGRYKTFIRIDLAGIIDVIGMNFISLKLVLDKIDSTDGLLEFYECRSSWHEHHLLWLRNMDYGPEPVLTVEASGSQVEVDVLEYVTDLLERGETTLNLVVESKDFVIMKAKESGTAPKLELRYTDPSWAGFIKELDMTNRAIIRAVGHKDFYSSYRLLEKFFQRAGALIKDPTLLQSSVWVNQPDFISSASVVVSSYCAAAAVVRADGHADLICDYDHNAMHETAGAEIPYRQDVYGSADVPPEYAVKDGDFRADVIRKYVFSLVEMVRSVYTNGSAVVRVTDHKALVSSAEIIYSYIYGQGNIREGSFLNAGAIKRSRPVSKDRADAAYMDKPYLYGSYHIGKSSGLAGSAFMKQFVHRHKVCAAVVPPPSEVTAGAVVRRQDHEDRAAALIMRRSGEHPLISNAEVPHRYDIVNSLHIRRQDNSDRETEAVIRQKGLIDAPSRAEMYVYRDLFSAADILQIKDLTGSAVARQFDVAHSRVEAFVSGGFHRSPVVSYADIGVKDAYLAGRAEINTKARIWLPNRQGELDFEDRKLPRLWIRENFITGENDT